MRLPATAGGGAVAGGVLGSLALLAFVACGPPPIGWQGAGRLQTLPSPQPDAGAPVGDSGGDSGDDASSPGPDPGSPVLDASAADDTSGDAAAIDGGVNDAGSVG